MATRSDFFTLRINKHFGDREGDLGGFSRSEYPFVENEFQTSFVIDEEPQDGYFLIQTFDINLGNSPHESQHQILINGTNVGGPFGTGLALPPTSTGQRWNTWMNFIPGGALERGVNTIQFKRALGADNFLIGFITLHWHEEVN